MTLSVRDSASNANENIEHAAKIIGRSKSRRAVFKAIYAGKPRWKSVSQLMAATSLSRVRVLQEGGRLAANEIVSQEKKDGEVAYGKIGFFQSHKAMILRLAADAHARAQFPTKRKVSGNSNGVVTFTVPRTHARTKQITIDDINSFANVKTIAPGGYLPRKVSEKRFKNGVQKILGQKGKFVDWGGEKNDLYSTRLSIGSKRYAVAFGFKGPATKGKLTPKKLGKNGDQIQRLFTSAAQVFLIQYWNEIDESVITQMEQLAIARSVFTGDKIFYGLLDGQDSMRLFRAYPNMF
jgi:hypothetical protein